MKRYLLGICVWCLGLVAMQAERYQTGVCQADIHTLRMRYVAEAEVAAQGETYSPTRPYLVIQNGTALDGSDPTNTLELSFDVFSHDYRQYTYMVKHLTRFWEEDDRLSSFEYVKGFTTADINQYELSQNTQQIYSHYHFTFPNENMQLLLSGNYVLIIYEDGDETKRVATICFSVVEPITTISVKQRSNTDIEFDGRYQQLDVEVNTRALDKREVDEITLVVRQNNRTDNEAVIQRPTYVETYKLRYLNQRKLIFEGGNEYRHFDAYSTYYAGYHVDRIRYGQGDYHAFLDPDEVRGTLAKGSGMTGSPYMTESDVNGQWVINSEKSYDVDTESEYMWVHWTLPVARPLMEGNVYVGGDVFQNRYTSLNMMKYDAENMCYTLEAYLKQGGYEYQYFVKNKDGQITLLPLEGSHWETRNEYSLWVYYRPFSCRYDRLVGVLYL